MRVHKNFYRSVLLLAGPIIVSQIGHTMVQTVNTMVVGHATAKPHISLAAVSLTHSVFMIVLVIGIGIAYGLTPLVAQYAKRDHERCANLLSNSLWLNIITSVVLFLLVYYGSMYIMEHSGQDTEVVIEAKPYLFLLGLSILPLMVFNTFKQFTEGLGFTKQAMSVSIWGNVINIALAWIFVKGYFGLPEMGVKGVGLATLIDRSLMMLAMALYVMKSRHFKSYMQYFSFINVAKERLRDIAKIGIPVALQYVFEVGAFAGASILAGQIGARDQAAHQVAITLVSMTYMMASGIGSASTIRVGNSFGDKNAFRIRSFSIASYHIILIFMAITALIFSLGYKILPYTITQDLEVIALASQLLFIAAFFQFFDGAQVVGLGVLRGMGDVNRPSIITFVAYWVIGLPLAYYLGIRLNMGVNGIWYGLTIGLLTSSILLYFRYRKMINSLTYKLAANRPKA